LNQVSNYNDFMLRLLATIQFKKKEEGGKKKTKNFTSLILLEFCFEQL